MLWLLFWWLAISNVEAVKYDKFITVIQDEYNNKEAEYNHFK